MIRNFLNKSLIKNIAVLSGLLGVILGLISIIPVIGYFTFFIQIILSAPLVIYYMKKLELFGYFDTKEGAIYGAIIGFVSFLGFSVSFFPLAAIIGFIFKGSSYSWVSWFFPSGVLALIMLIFFVTLLSALMNAFSGLVAVYLYNQIEEKPEEVKTEIDID